MAVIDGECVRVDGAGRDPGRLIITPHPVVLDGQTNIVADLREGETLGAFLSRHIDLAADLWEVRIGGVLVPAEIWHMVRPKHGQVIEVRGAVHKQALYLVAMLALTYFTFGIGTAGGAILSGYGVIAAAAVYIAGAIIINKVLGPKPAKENNRTPDSVYSLTGARNAPRPYEPVPLLFGSVRITPDIASMPYTWFAGNDQWLGMVLNCGINVGSVTDIRNGDTPLGNYQGVALYYNGFASMPSQPIPLYSNADTIAGGELSKDATWVQRTTPLDTIRIQIDIEYVLGDMTAKGDNLNNSETVVAEYAPAGSGAWTTLGILSLRNNTYDTKRTSIIRDVPAGQYDVRVHRLGRAIEILRGRAQFVWTTMTAVQADPATYAGLARIGIMVKATGQLNGAMDELRATATAAPMPYWNGSAWVTATTRENGLSNPGAQILQYARGFRDSTGNVIAGIGLSDEQIDIPALQAFMLHCAANGYTFDAYIRDARSHDEMLAAIALAGMGQVTWAGGRLSVAWVGAGEPIGGVVNMATIKRAQFQVDYTLANAADGIEYTYFDRTDWQPKTLRVAAPGVTTPLNPAAVQGEGVTTEAHAARLARWHMAQSIYQYKDVTYSTDLEHLSYRRLSVLALQHDLTQWGFGGRLAFAQINGSGDIDITLDDEVPAPASGNAYMGLRIPGENGYRVFAVRPFAGPARSVTLAGPWPAGIPFPGDSDTNPAHDTVWIYDFKQTPGLRVRVVGIEPESDLKGARVSVVPEGDEFWNYVLNGTYTPPANNSLLPVTPPKPTGLAATPMADAVLLTWLASPVRNVTYLIERAPDVGAGETPEWVEIGSTADLRYTVPEPVGMPVRYRIRAASFGRLSPYSDEVVSAPISSNPATIEIPIIGGVATINCLYDQFSLRLDQDATVQFVNVPFVKTILIEIEQVGGNHVLTWPASVVPVSGQPYVVSTADGAVDMVGLMTNTQGVTWRLTAQKAGDGGDTGTPLVVSVAPNPASDTVTTDGTTPTSPGVNLTATITGAAGTPEVMWTRADMNGGTDFLISDATSLTPFIYKPGGTTALPPETQDWRITVTDGARISQAVVPVTLARNVVAPSGGSLSGDWGGSYEGSGMGATGTANGARLQLNVLSDGTWYVTEARIINGSTRPETTIAAGAWAGTPNAGVGGSFEVMFTQTAGSGGTLTNGAPTYTSLSTGRALALQVTTTLGGEVTRSRTFDVTIRPTGDEANKVTRAVTFTITGSGDA